MDNSLLPVQLIVNLYNPYLVVKFTNTINDSLHLEGFPIKNTWRMI